MATTNTQTGAARFAAHMEQYRDIYEVTAPSGFTYRLTKPSQYSLLAIAGELPEEAASYAVQSWRANGVVPNNTTQELSPKSQAAIMRAYLKIRTVLHHCSVDPKLVEGEPQNENEVSFDLLPKEDEEFLHAWLRGGEEGKPLRNFSGGSKQSPLASANRGKVRSTAKSPGRNGKGTRKR